MQFKVKHLMMSTVTGSFKQFGAEAELEGDDLTNAQVSFWADTPASSPTTKRDAHLRSPDFLRQRAVPEAHLHQHPHRRQRQRWKVTGDLTIKGVTKPVTLDVEWSGQGRPWGQHQGGLNLSGRSTVREWGLTWNAALETGGVLVSDEVRILCEVQLAHQA